jgi:hypothetical protein
MPRTPDSLPDDVEALKAALIEARAKLSGAQALIEQLQLTIAKMKREHFGPRSERSQRLLDQLELQLEELAAAAGDGSDRKRTPILPSRRHATAHGCSVFSASRNKVNCSGTLFRRPHASRRLGPKGCEPYNSRRQSDC